MSDLLVRGLDEDLKRRLEQRAAKNNRSQQQEAMAILRAALIPDERSWIAVLADAAKDSGGADLELPERHPAREFEF